MSVSSITLGTLVLALTHRQTPTLFLFLAWRLVDESVDDLVRPALSREGRILLEDFAHVDEANTIARGELNMERRFHQ
jgi:hypothetical protein